MSKWVRGTRGGFRCRYKCCSLGGRRGLAQAKRGHARAVRRAARLAIEDEVDGRDAEAALEAFEASGDEAVPSSEVTHTSLCEQCGDCLDCDVPHECYFTHPKHALDRALDKAAARLAADSVSLDPDAARILYDNLWDLYL